MSPYLLYKLIHILSSVALVGVGGGSAFYMYFTLRTRNVEAIAAVIGLFAASSSLNYIRNSLEGWPFWITLEPNPRIVAFVVARDAGAAPAEQEVIEFVGKALSKHKRPREIRFVEELPRNAMGKVQKARLK